MTSPVAFLVTNYQSTKLAQRAVKSIRLHEPNATILVVDNNSPLSESEVQDFLNFGATRIVRNLSNLGYTASLNIGFSELAGAKIVFVHDADALTIMPASDCLLRQAEKEPKEGIWGVNLVDFNGQPTGNVSLTHTPLELLLGQALSLRMSQSKYSYILGLKRVLAIHGCAMAVRHDTWKKLGGFDESFSFYGTDIDFCYRAAKELKIKSKVIPEITMIHEGGATQILTSQRVLDWHSSAFKFLTKHNLIKSPHILLLKFGLLTRHSLEYTLACLMGYWLWKDKQVKKDKIQGRKKMILAAIKGYSKQEALL